MKDIHDMTEAMKAEFLGAFSAHFGFGEMTATANDDAAAMLKAAAWAWKASREAVVVELPQGLCMFDMSGGRAPGGLPLIELKQAADAIEAAGLKYEVKP